MTRNILTFVLAIFTFFGNAADEKGISSEIEHVTVFLNGAQVTRDFNATLKPGTQTLNVIGLSPYLDPKTIQIKGDGEFTILSIRHQINHLDETQLEEKIVRLTDSITYFQRQALELNTELAVLNASDEFLRFNKGIKGQNDNLDVATLRGVHQYYFDELMSIRKEINKINYKRLDINKTLGRYRDQLNEINRKLTTTTSEVLVEVQSDKSTKGDFQLSYLVNQAGWYPSYDVRVQDINNPLKLVYKANVYQNTGEDWENVMLTFSNANPYQSGDLPILTPYYLNYTNAGYSANPYKANATQNSYNLNNYISSSNARVSGKVTDAQGQAIPFATVRVQGTAVATISDEAGNWSLTMPQGKNQVYVNYIGYQDRAQVINPNIDNQIVLQESQAQLSEVMVAANRRLAESTSDYASFATPTTTQGLYANDMASYEWSFKGKRKYESKPITVLPLENQTTLEIKLDIPFTVKSTGKPKVVSMNEVEIPAYYEYRSVPKLEKAAFLIARITDWSSYNLLEGEANLYFENTYIGRSILDVRFMTDTLNVSLGRDKNVLVDRQKVKSLSTREFIGNDHIEKRQFNLVVRNNKSQAINLIVYDQIPLSQRPKDIEVELKDKSGAKQDEKTGELKWEFGLDPGKTKEMTLKYQVKFPKNQMINLE